MTFGNVLILGDSISTFAGWVPEGYVHHYYSSGGSTDIRQVEETWWHQIITETNSNLVMNNSWSGTTICYTGYDGIDYSAERSFITRFDKLYNEGFFEQNKIDTLFVFGGTNDNWADAPLGETMYEGQTKEDLYKVLPAIPFLMRRIREVLPDAEVIWIINTELKDVIVNAMLEGCKRYGFKEVVLHDIDKMVGHQSIKGMLQTKEQILVRLAK